MIIFDQTKINKMKKLLLLSLCFSSATLIAQPTLTSANIGYVIGDTQQEHQGLWIDPGAAGPNQSWDFTGFSETGTAVLEVVDPAATTNGSSFVGATVGVRFAGTTATSYYNISSTAYSFAGIDANGTIVHYSDNEDALRFPMTYGDQFTDNLFSTFFSGATFNRSGSNTTEADGYGTLTLPDGSVIVDVLRIHTVQDYTDVVPNTTQIDYLVDLYNFYSPGIHYPILSIGSIQTTQSGLPPQTQTYSSYRETSPNDIRSDELILGIYPNPTSDRLFLNTMKEIESVSVISSTGRQVYRNSYSTNAGIDVSDFPNGIYMLNVTDRDGKTFDARFIKR